MRPRGAHPVYWRTFEVETPTSWDIREFRQLAENFKGKLPNQVFPDPTPNSVPYLLVEGLETGAHGYTDDDSVPIVNSQDTVVVADGSRSGWVMRGKEGALGSTLLCYRPKDGVDPDFLFYLLQSFYGFTNTATIGGAVPHLDTRLLDRLWIAAPVEEAEQTRIGSTMRSVDSAITAAEAKLTAARRLKTALMQQLFTRGIPGLHTEFQQTKWFTAPASWKPRRLRDIAKVEAGFTMGRDLSRYETVEVDYLTVINVLDGRLDLSEIEKVQVKVSELDELLLKPRDILMTEGGDRDKLGRGGIWCGEVSPCVYQNHIFRVRFHSNTYQPELFHFLIQSWQAKNYFYAHAKQTSNLCTINSRELKAFSFFEPEADEQAEMIGLLNAAENQLRAVEAEIAVLEKLKRSLLQNLITGRVRLRIEA
ncbi:MAG TPA: restriction endonuclease subunit S [Candidatus Binatia bacterium]|jgi:type I restriction enzyme S subunit